MKQFACGAVVPGCERVFAAPDEQRILNQVAAHAHRDHGIDEIPLELVAAVRQHIYEVAA
jgi:predicted small metal-binding protein